MNFTSKFRVFVWEGPYNYKLVHRFTTQVIPDHQLMSLIGHFLNRGLWVLIYKANHDKHHPGPGDYVCWCEPPLATKPTAC